MGALTKLVSRFAPWFWTQSCCSGPSGSLHSDWPASVSVTRTAHKTQLFSAASIVSSIVISIVLAIVLSIVSRS
jgi:hypothetical protein